MTRKTRLRKQCRSAKIIHRHNIECLKLAKNRHPLGIAVFPDEIVTNIVKCMDGPTALCFALTAPENYMIVGEVKKKELQRTNCNGERLGFKRLLPQFENVNLLHALLAGDYTKDETMIVSPIGKTRHEHLIRLLWLRLDSNCVYCGEAAKMACNDGHLCRGFLIVDDARALAESGAATDIRMLTAVTTQSTSRSSDYDDKELLYKPQVCTQRRETAEKNKALYTELARQAREKQDVELSEKEFEEWLKQREKEFDERVKDRQASLSVLADCMQSDPAKWKTPGVDVDALSAKVRGMAALSIRNPYAAYLNV